jgi:hypothetical protein
MVQKRVYAYFDGSNFYKLSILNYGTSKVKYNHLTNYLIDTKTEKLIRIKYFICPVNQQECPQLYSSQQKFFGVLRKTPLLDIVMGKLVSRHLNKIRVDCPSCGIQEAEELQCPNCDNKIKLTNTFKTTEKGIDVSLAIHILLDALEDKYDTALVFSSDADICPAIKYIIKSLNKEVIYCRFPTPRTDELIQSCSDTRMVTSDIINNSLV